MEGEICETRYCDVGTIMADDNVSVHPLKYVEEYTIDPKNIPKKMDPLEMRKEHRDRRAYKQDMVAKNAKAKTPIRIQAKTDYQGVAQLKLEILLGRLEKEGVQYSSISSYFDHVIRGSAISRELKSIVSEILVKDRSDLVNSTACYASAIQALRRRSGIDMEALSGAIDDLARVLIR